MSGPFFESELAEKFFDEVESFPIWDEWKNTVEAAWIANPFFLSESKIGESLADLIEKVAPNLRNARTNEEKKASDLLVDVEIQSGLQVYQTGLSQFGVANTFRRRVKGFLYKRYSIVESG
ncbi:MAG: hypothetical protein P8O16_17695 [Algoriphagus sp.]|uniref:hypothetical protein n=1 Tax=Algoriphagus sp. TaxID=1872435 RepID=UPI0026093118|nr:hypothetical protein [Algoriphagus sp.]MDG1279118.1 hypothetical protein [Algoriphagus sp.]